jgi:hypothetical protein
MDHGKLPGPFLELVEIDSTANPNSSSLDKENVPVLTDEQFLMAAVSFTYSNDQIEDGIALRVRDRVESVRKRDEKLETHTSVISDVGLSETEASDRVSKLRKGLAKAIDSTYQTELNKYSNESKEIYPARLSELPEDEEFKLDLDGKLLLYHVHYIYIFIN